MNEASKVNKYELIEVQKIKIKMEDILNFTNLDHENQLYQYIKRTYSYLFELNEDKIPVEYVSNFHLSKLKRDKDYFDVDLELKPLVKIKLDKDLSKNIDVYKLELLFSKYIANPE